MPSPTDPVAFYAKRVDDLSSAHDEVLKHPRGTPENLAAYAVARRLYRSAKTYAQLHQFENPNAILRRHGYRV